MPTNDFIGFASAGSANIMSQADYAAAAEQGNGVQPGMASSKLANKIWRQGANMAAALGEMIKAQGIDALDNGDIATLSNNLVSALSAFLLPLAGGTLTGAVVFSGLSQIIKQADNAHQISILSGINGNSQQGAKFMLNGAGYSSDPGAFVLQAGDSGGYKQLLGKPDGTLTWGGGDVATIQTGTFTPSLAGSETAGEATYSTRKGYYVRVGSLVYITGEVNGSFNTLPSGRVVLNGLPYSAGTIGEQASIVVYGHSGGVSNSISRLVNATVYNNFLRLHIMSSRETAAQGLGKMDWASWSTTSGDSYYIHITPENASFRLFWGGCYMVS